MALGQTNISLSLIKSTLGVYSTNSITRIVALASIGGVGGYAFRLYETRASNGQVYDGKHISGAKPYWNMWSRYIPAEWEIVGGTLVLRLKRNALNENGGYDFRLGDFREYDHVAHKPVFQSATEVDAVSGAFSIGFSLYLGQVKFPADITHIKAIITIGAQVITQLIPLSSVQNPTVYAAQEFGFDVTNVPTNVTSGSVVLKGSNSSSYEICTLNNFLTSATDQDGTRSFTITHIAQANPKLSVAADIPYDAYVELSVSVTNPYSSDGLSIEIPFGVTSISNITIDLTAYSSTIQSGTVDLYFYSKGSTVYVGQYQFEASENGSSVNINNVYVSLSSPAAANEIYYFYIESINY